MHPGALRPRQRDQLGEGVERAAAPRSPPAGRPPIGPRAPRAPRASASGRIRPSPSAAATCTRAAPKPSSRRLRQHRGMRLAAEHHVHLRRAEEPLRLHVPAGPAQQRAPRRRERGEVRHRRPGAEADAGPAGSPSRSSSQPAATSSTAAAAGVGSAKPPSAPRPRSASPPPPPPGARRRSPSRGSSGWSCRGARPRPSPPAPRPPPSAGSPASGTGPAKPRQHLAVARAPPGPAPPRDRRGR